MAKRLLIQLTGFAAGIALVVSIFVITGGDLGVTRAQDVPAAPLAISQVLHYQGRLLDPDTGDPKPDGGYTMAFNIYNAPSGGSPLWTESKTVQASKGVFSTLLGDTTPLDLSIFNGQELYLGVSVGGDPEATPRQRLTHAAYAMHAENAGKLDGQDSAAFAAAGHTHTGGDIVDGTIGNADLANDSVTSGKIANETVGDSDIRDTMRTISYPANALNHDTSNGIISQYGTGLRWQANYASHGLPQYSPTAGLGRS